MSEPEYIDEPRVPQKADEERKRSQPIYITPEDEPTAPPPPRTSAERPGFFRGARVRK